VFWNQCGMGERPGRGVREETDSAQNTGQVSVIINSTGILPGRTEDSFG